MNLKSWFFVLALAMTGCGPSGAPLDKPVNVSGSVLDSQGKPIGNVTLNLQPLENGYAQFVELPSDGKFSLETQAGKYAWFFTPKSGTKQVPPAVKDLTAASMDRTVVVSSGSPLEIKLP